MGDRVYVAGHGGMVGSALVRRLQQGGVADLVLRKRSELDLTDQAATRRFFQEETPEQVYLAAAKVGGILANSTYPAQFIRENLAIQTNVIHEASRAGTKKLLFLGSSCIYPRDCPQPIREESLMTGPLEPTNAAYATAKIAGIQMCQAYRQEHGFDAICAMPTNLYGPGDNYDLQTAHALPALLRRFHEAKERDAPEVVAWGTGTPRREFLHVDDLAEACLVLMSKHSSPDLVNVGTGTDLSIAELTGLIAKTIGFRGRVRFDPAKPDGTPRKVLDVSRLKAYGWAPRIPLEQGLAKTYEDYRKGPPAARAGGASP